MTARQWFRHWLFALTMLVVAMKWLAPTSVRAKGPRCTVASTQLVLPGWQVVTNGGYLRVCSSLSTGHQAAGRVVCYPLECVP